MTSSSDKSFALQDDPFAGLEDALEYSPARAPKGDFGEREARRLLPHVWHAFFGRFGRLTDPQLAAIKPIVEGKSVVLCAATASGKTEALLGPMLERTMQRAARKSTAQRFLRVIILCPTRALCNDFLRRVRRPIQACNLSVDLKSGDSPNFDPDRPPNVLITTPESLDSLLSRKPHGLKNLESIFLDEVHLLDGGNRGDHTRALVARIKSFRPNLQICCASATAPQAERLGLEFAQPNSPEDLEILRVQGGRDRDLSVEYEQFHRMRDAAASIYRLTQNQLGSKILVFANKRDEVEYIAALLAAEDGLPVFAHHGSLAKPERLRAERGFLNATHGVCVATMTLELGIDIGNVDRVVLLNPPANVASFTQRIGRSNRRGGDIQVTCLYASAFDLQRFEHLVKCARAGQLFVEAIPFRPSILPQQATSLLFQNPDNWVSDRVLHKRLPPDVAAEWTRADCRAVLETMRREGYFHANARGQFVADEPARRDYRYGQMHTHIDPDGEVEVIDETTGRQVGTALLSRKDKSRLEESSASHVGFLLAGKQRKVTRVKDQKIFVQSNNLPDEPSFLSRMGPRYSFDLARDLADFVGVEEKTILMHPTGARDGWYIEHFFGSIWGWLLDAVLEHHGFMTNTKGGISHFQSKLKYKGTPPESLGDIFTIQTAAEKFLDDTDAPKYKALLRSLQPGPWLNYVPDDMVQRWVYHCARPADFADTLAEFRVVVV